MGQAPKQTLVEKKSFDFTTTNRGKIKLLETYKKMFGNPEDHGHEVAKATWKDGSIRDVVVMPELADDELEVACRLGSVFPSVLCSSVGMCLCLAIS